MAIHSDADIFLIDEILAVGDESYQEKCLNKINEFKNKNKTILFVSHNKDLVKDISDRIIYIEKGSIKEII